MDKKIEVVTLKVRDIKTNFGNPRKITKAKRDELKASLENFGDFGMFLIDENNDIIAGNMRHSILMEEEPNREVLCKKLIGYTDAEKRAINIKDNVHSGIWDIDLLADWTADLNIDLGLDDKPLDERKIDKMELVRFEKYDYVIIACDNEIDYNELTRNLGIDGKKVGIAKRHIKARAIWYNDIKAQIVPKDEI
jgi:hypothetical protein